MEERRRWRVAAVRKTVAFGLREFESLLFHHFWPLGQVGSRRRAFNPETMGSNPTGAAKTQGRVSSDGDNPTLFFLSTLLLYIFPKRSEAFKRYVKKVFEIFFTFPSTQYIMKT